MILWALLLLPALFGFVQLIVQLNKRRKRLAIGVIFLLLFIAGTAIHVILLARSTHTYTEGNWIQLAVMSMVAALEMFIGHSVVFDDIIAAVIFSEPFLLLSYITIFLFVVAFTFSLVILIMPRRLRDRIWLSINSSQASKNLKNHIFLGVNKPSKLLAKQILEQWSKSREKKGKLILVEFPDKESSKAELSIGEVFSSIFGQKTELSLEEELENDKFILLKGHMPDSSDKDGLCEAIGLEKLKKWLENPRTSLYLLNPDDHDNFLLLKTLNADSSVKAKAFFYTHEAAGFNNLFAAIGQRIRVLNPHFLSFMHVKMHREDLLPVNYVDLARDKDGEPLGYVNEGLNAMIIGFGDSGQEALRFLLEFGTFIGKDLNEAQGCIQVMDPELDSHMGQFLSGAPGLKGNSLIKWTKASAGDTSFWAEFDAALDSGLRYIVITIDTGKKNVELGVKMLEMAAAKGIDLSRFVILMRVWEASVHLKGMIDYFNRAFCPEGVDVLKYFGQPENIWMPDVISGKSLKQAAIKTNKAFEEALHEESWDARAARLNSKGGNPLARRRELFRRQALEIGRALYLKTLKHFASAKIIEASKDIPLVYEGVHYPKKDQNYKHLEYLAAMEHLHWLYAMLIGGYRDGEIDELHRFHTNMLPYKEIAKEQYNHISWLGVKTLLECLKSVPTESEEAPRQS